MNRSELTNLDVTKLFEDRSIEDIIGIEKSLNAEIERKRNDLRSMVGDRYKDILAASDAIKSMKTISEGIVSNIEEITKTCEVLLTTPNSDWALAPVDLKNEKQRNDERVLLIQVRLAIFLNEQIWIALDSGHNLNATQYYLLAQHIIMELSLTKREYLGRLPLLGHLKLNLVTLRAKIFEMVTLKLESVEITPEETSRNLNALMLIENQTNEQLLSIFIEHRKTALNTIISMEYASVRLQVAAMVKCLITTVLLLHDCFVFGDNKNSLLWEELNSIVEDKAPSILSKLELPVTPLITYIPDIIREFRPKLTISDAPKEISRKIIADWLTSTQHNVQQGLGKSLLLITTLKGLHLIRDEGLKIELPEIWAKACQDLGLPEGFNVWCYFFQKNITSRAEALISTIISNNINGIKSDISASLARGKNDSDLRSFVWQNDDHDVSKDTNDCSGLAMKTRGFPPAVVDLCEKLDRKFLGLLEDASYYLYGTELNRAPPQVPYLLDDYKFKRKFVDRDPLERHMMVECSTHSLRIPDYITDSISSESGPDLIERSLFCARFLQACCALCGNFRRCCQVGTEWQEVCSKFTRTGLQLWSNWVKDTARRTSERVQSPSSMMRNLSKWDEIDIEEQAEERVFNSRIRVPLKPGLPLCGVLVQLNEELAKVLPYTLPKSVHVEFVEANANVILKEYEAMASRELNQIEALQFLLDVRFLSTLCVPRENTQMVSFAQDICDKLRGKIDPFDLDVFYPHIQNNVKKAIGQSQTLFGCLLTSSAQLMNLGAHSRGKEQESSPTLMALSTPSSSAWFPLLPITAPSQKLPGAVQTKPAQTETSSKPSRVSPKRPQDPASVMRQSAASLFGTFSTDWFS